ncbi:VapC toxin family PIN domain ribonuclease [bacterium]|nr:MAG: VapC toxin family PIN domain ribonuclease [bacterium]
MILVDANLLVYAHHPGFRQHAAARAWLDEQLGGSTQVALPWPSLLAFLRLSINGRVLERPLSASAAWAQVEAWLSVPVAWVPVPTERHAEVLAHLMRSSVSSHALVTDAHLAALALEHGLVLCSSDGDFARFPGLRWSNPLAAT